MSPLFFLFRVSSVFLFSSSFSSYNLFVLYLFHYPFFSLYPFYGSLFFYIIYIYDYICIYDCLCMFPCSIRFFLLLVVFIVYHAQSFSYPSLCWSIFLALCFPFLEGLPLLSPIFFLSLTCSSSVCKFGRNKDRTAKPQREEPETLNLYILFLPCSFSTVLFPFLFPVPLQPVSFYSFNKVWALKHAWNYS